MCDPLDPEFVAKILSSPPFVTISGVHNVRDLGLMATFDPHKVTKPKFLYRSAEISSITEEGKAQMKALGVTSVFDLRSDTEIEKYNTPLPAIDGIELVRTPVFQKEDYSPEMMAKRYSLYASAKTEAFMELYSQILEHGGAAFGAILRHVRDRPTEGCLFHCTAGKDRTGIIAAILLKLAGVKDELIADDYSLSRVGREPVRAMVMARLSKEPLFASDNQAALNMLTSRHETMTAFLSLLQEKYGGVQEYVKHYIGLSEDDINIIQKNLVVSSSS